MGIIDGSTVSFIMLDVPEVFFMWLALSKMGAVTNLIKFDEGSERIALMNNIGNADYMFISEVPFIINNVVESLKEGNNAKEIVTVPIKSSGSVGEKFNNEKFLSFQEWNEKYPVIEGRTIDGGADNVSIIVYTGGTTGSPKGVEITNKNIVASTHALKYSEVGFDEGKSSLNILPPGPSYYIHATYGLICCGVSVHMISNFTLDEYPSLIEKYKPNIFLSGPILLKNIVDKDLIEDASFITGPMSGGDKLHLSEEERINQYFRNKNSNAVVLQGYGESESTGAASICKKNAYKLGSVGVPLINIDVAIFDYTTYEDYLKYGVKEKRYNEIGEICISGPTLMQGYKNNIEDTNNVLRLHDDGKIWLHTDDLGYIDEDGRIFHCGRAKRMLTRTGAKVWLSALEDAIKKHRNVHDCCCVKMDDEIEREVPVAHIILKDAKLVEKTCLELDEIIKNSHPLTYVPKYYILRNSIPITEVNNKVDFKSLEEENIFDNKKYDVMGKIIKPISL